MVPLGYFRAGEFGCGVDALGGGGDVLGEGGIDAVGDEVGGEGGVVDFDDAEADGLFAGRDALASRVELRLGSLDGGPVLVEAFGAAAGVLEFTGPEAVDGFGGLGGVAVEFGGVGVASGLEVLLGEGLGGGDEVFGGLWPFARLGGGKLAPGDFDDLPGTVDATGGHLVGQSPHGCDSRRIAGGYV